MDRVVDTRGGDPDGGVGTGRVEQDDEGGCWVEVATRTPDRENQTEGVRDDVSDPRYRCTKPISSVTYTYRCNKKALESGQTPEE